MIPLKVDILRTRAAICNGFLIILNVLVFFYELSLPPRAGESLIYAFGLIPSHTELLFSHQGITLSQAFHSKPGVPAPGDEHVSARRMDASVGQHALSLGLRG